MSFCGRALVGAVVLLAGCAGSLQPRDRFVVASDRGPLVGRVHDGARSLLGVPFAAPPVGARRWLPPAPPAAWTQPRDAGRPGPACMQLGSDGKLEDDISEDCLTLDVWSPRGGGRRRAVLVFIHGGAFVAGDAGEKPFDGANLAARSGAVVVTLNYRLGALGFLGPPEVARELGRAHAPAVGLLDQQAALGWVQRNIAAVGGDPRRVTIFGESAGAWSVCAQLTMPGSRGLFARAIIESGACSDALYFTAAQAEARTAALAQAVGCAGATPLACLRGRDAAAIVRALPEKRRQVLTPGVWWGPIVDGVDLPRLPLASIRAGDFAHVPVIVGANHDEGILHTFAFDQVSAAEQDDFVRDSFGEAAVAPVALRYRRATAKEALTDIIGDGIFVCGARRTARALAAAGAPVFLYHFTHTLDDPRLQHFRATHTVELMFVFANRLDGVHFSAREERLIALMSGTWGRFARSGDPNGDGLVWPRYTLAADAHAALDLAPSVGRELARATCDFWDGVERP